MKRPLFALDRRFVTELDLPGSPQAIEWESRLFLLQSDDVYAEVRELPVGVRTEQVSLPDKQPARPRFRSKGRPNW